MAKYAGLPWDCMLSAELMQHYKPDPETYLTAAALLSLRLEQVMMVAAHKGDLQAAQAVGLQTAFVPRPMAWSPERTPDLMPDQAFTVHPSILTIWLPNLVYKLHASSQGLSHIRGRHGLDKGFLKIRSVFVELIREEALPATPHTSDSSVAGGPIVTEVHNGYHVAQIVFNDLPFPFTIYHTNTDLEFTLTSGDKHSSSFGQNVA
jgi:hypothetical protein